MKLRHLLPAAFALPLTGCGFIGQTLGTVTNTAGSLIRTVTSPISGILNVADEGSEKAWRDKAAAQSQQDHAHDRRPVKTKRPR